VAGGGIASISTGTDVEIMGVDLKNSVFENNRACVSNLKKSDCYGGGAVAYNESITISGSTFENNNVASASSDDRGDGGALLNLAIPNVGGDDYIYVSSDKDEALSDVSTTNIRNSTFMNNNAGSSGGAAHVKGDVTLTLCRFEANHAYNKGGAVHLYKGAMTIDKCNFTDNRSTSHGGAVFLGDDPYGNHMVTNSLFTNNSCGGDGAAIYGASDFEGAAYLDVRSSNFSSNTADGVGGAICRVKAFSVIGLVTVEKCTFISNQAYSAGAIYSDLNVNITSVLLANNTAAFGGAMQLIDLSNQLFNVTLINNTALYQGNINNHSSFVRTLSNMQRSH
jgi:predicted outer membrane repeat protein